MVGEGGRETVTVEYWDVPSPAHSTDIVRAVSLMEGKRAKAFSEGATHVGDVTLYAQDEDIRVQFSYTRPLPGPLGVSGA